MNTNYASLQNSFSHHIKISGNVLLACATYKSLLLGTLGLAYVIQNYSAISLECMKLSFGYIFGSAFELFGFAISLAKLVGNGNFSPYYFVKNGNFNLYSFLVVDQFGYISSQCVYWSTLDC
ncbi:hypothetical protein MtrunA17_Chr7g0217291 [Medicago truncatula]|uniref:Transmembrane protein n=1 Tax=Medicago truncatula TaxID=3880 RepID=A0A396GXR3_MEDTR|nr:hypothetical protein MtrunA17_Chr7g0217291 [Medicago truncatula]